MLTQGNVVLVSFRGSCFNQRIILTHTYVVEGTGDPTVPITNDYAEIAAQLEGGGGVDVETPYRALLPEEYSLETLRVQMISPIRLAFQDTSYLNTPGTNVGDASAANRSVAITFRTQLAGRNQIATKHIGPVPDAAGTNGVVQNAYLQLMDNLAAALLSTFNIPVIGGATVSLRPCIFHRATGSTTPLVGYTNGNTLRVQRRRTVNVGE